MPANPVQADRGVQRRDRHGQDKTIYALAPATFVVAADAERGGTWQGAVEATRKGYGRVAVWVGPGGGDGNDLLARRGARPVADLEDLLHEPDHDPGVEQLRLGL